MREVQTMSTERNIPIIIYFITFSMFCCFLQISGTLHHPNLLLLMGICIKDGQLVMVTEYLSRGSVYQVLRPPKTEDIPSFRVRMTMAKQCAQGMNWLHQQTSLLHLDLKTPNLLVDENFNVKIADFGLSKYKSEELNKRVGSPYFMAPEMLLSKPYDSKADVYR